MKARTNSLLAALQYGDSFFPSGSTSLSWGLETLIGEGLLRSEEGLEEFVLGQISGRWATFDRAVLVSAHTAAPDIEVVAEIDLLVEAHTLAREQREGSRKAGLAILSVHARLGTPTAAAYEDLCRAGDALAHLSVIQGLLWRAVGLQRDEAIALSAHQFCIGFLGAALRLGLVGHLGAQRILKSAQPEIRASSNDRELPTLQELSVFTPESDIAVMRHETSSSRLFAN